METWSKKLNFKKTGEKYGSPIYIFNIGQLKENFSQYLKIVKKKGNIAFPIKSNPSLAVARQIQKLGGSLECSSESEVNIAKITGFTSDNIIFNSPAEDTEYCLRLLKEGCTVVADSIEVLNAVNEEYLMSPFTGRVFVRLNPNISIEYAKKEDYQDLTSHGSSTAKFGIVTEMIYETLAKIKVPVTGLHIHVGTQMDNMNSFINIINFLHETAHAIGQKTHHKIKYLNLGGGLGIDFTQDDSFPTIEDLYKAISKVQKDEFSYIIEPGHSLIGNTMGILTKVIKIKQIRNKKWAIVDVGTDQLAKITLIHWSHQVLAADNNPLPFEGKDSLGGPLCFSGDTLLQNTSLDNVKKGDYLFVQHCGAYCYSLGNHFNGRHYQGMVVLNEDGTITRTNNPETEVLSHIYETFNWDNDYSEWETPETLEVKSAEQLISQSHWNTSADHNEYNIIKFERLSENSFRLLLDIKAKTDFIPVPLALKIVTDVAITSFLYSGENKIKSSQIWEDTLVIHASNKLKPGKLIDCKISLSPVTVENNKAENTLIADFSLGQGKFKGMLKLKFKL